MNNEKIKYLIKMINDMDIENKLKLAICMCEKNSCANLQYDKAEMHKYFDNLLRKINIEYKTYTINFANYPLIIFAMAKVMEINSVEQNRVALYLFNNINYEIEKYLTNS